MMTINSTMISERKKEEKKNQNFKLKKVVAARNLLLFNVK